MDKPSTLFTGIFGAFIVSTGLMVALPHSQISGLQSQVTWEEGANSPAAVFPVKIEHSSGSRHGQQIYLENGCYYCHTQQVRRPQFGPDIERGWGLRQTVARDFIYESTPLLGATRIGPDLTNYGAKDENGVRLWRNEQKTDPKAPVRDAQFIFKHLFNPRARTAESLCPPYKGMFELQPIAGTQMSPDAVAKDENSGKQWMPNSDARLLADYLLSLNRTYELKEAAAAATDAKPKEAKK